MCNWWMMCRMMEARMLEHLYPSMAIHVVSYDIDMVVNNLLNLSVVVAVALAVQQGRRRRLTPPAPALCFAHCCLLAPGLSVDLACLLNVGAP